MNMEDDKKNCKVQRVGGGRGFNAKAQRRMKGRKDFYRIHR
jgi:hypothetical protein